MRSSYIKYDYVYSSRYFNRDVNCVRELFRRKYGYEGADYPKFSDLKREDDLDAEVRCTGYNITKEMEHVLLKVC